MNDLTHEERAELRRLAPEYADLSAAQLAAYATRYPSMFADLAAGRPTIAARRAVLDAEAEAAARQRYTATRW